MLGGLLAWLLSHTAEAMLGLIIGLIAARVIRGRHLHWSWAALPLPVIVLAGNDMGGLTLIAAVAALTATRSGRRRHRLDRQTGGDLAALARVRRTPLDAARVAAARLMGAVRAPVAASRPDRSGRFLIGRDQRGRAVSVALQDGASGRHTLVVGATGSGKTVTQTALALLAIEQGSGAVIVDPKGDQAMCSAVRDAAARRGRAFVLWTPGGGSVYNPFGRGSDTEIADKVLAGERFTEPHYLRQAQRYLGHAVRALRASGTEVSLQALVAQLDPQRLEVLSRSLDEDRARATQDYLDSLTTRQRADLAGVRDRLAILAESDVGVWLDPASGSGGSFDLLEQVLARSVVYFSLEADSRPLLTQMLGAAIVQDLQTAVASLQGRPTPTLIVIDEFSAIAAEQVVRLFGRARSAGFSLLLGTQEISDLRPSGGAGLLEPIMGNLSLLIAHRQVVPASAELIASVAGTRGAWRTSHRSDGSITRTRTREGVLGRDDVMGLARGWAAVIGLGEGGRARIARILPPQLSDGRGPR